MTKRSAVESVVIKRAVHETVLRFLGQIYFRKRK